MMSSRWAPMETGISAEHVGRWPMLSYTPPSRGTEQQDPSGYAQRAGSTRRDDGRASKLLGIAVTKLIYARREL